MRMYILEDQVIQATYLKRLIEEIMATDFNQPLEVETYYRPETLIESVQQSVNSALYFLDIKIKEDREAGLAIAQKIRQLDRDAMIVFVTTHPELAFTSYQYMVSALTFIDKNVEDVLFRQQVHAVLQRYVEQFSNQEEAELVLNATTLPLHIKWKDLYYFEVVGNHMIRASTGQRFVEFYGSLTDIAAEDQRLWRTHQAYLVNSEQIRLYDSRLKQLILKNGVKLPVTRTYHKRLANELASYEGRWIE